MQKIDLESQKPVHNSRKRSGSTRGSRVDEDVNGESAGVVGMIKRGWKRFRTGLRAPPLPDTHFATLNSLENSADEKENPSPAPIVIDLPEVDDNEVDEIIVDNVLRSPDRSPPPPPTSWKFASSRDNEEKLEEMDVNKKSQWLTMSEKVIWRFCWGQTFQDRDRELAFQTEWWHSQKRIAFCVSLFQVVIWIFVLALLPEPWTEVEIIVYRYICPPLLVALPVFVYFDFPLKRWWIWQIALFVQTWLWASTNLYDLYFCGYYDPKKMSCHGRDFLATFFYGLQAPVLALLAMGQSRFFSILGTAYWVGLTCGLILPYRYTWIRHVVNFTIFNAILVLQAYMQETNLRKTFNLKEQLKTQHIALAKAQVRERKASDSKKRFFNYLFHEIRVPLNTALLAVQNMQAAGVFDNLDGSDQNVEFIALEGSLVMVQNVLNDVLDFNRMEAGRFATSYNPFSFHKLIKSLLGSARVGCQNKKLTLIESLDERVELSARALGCLALGRKNEAECCSDGLVCGDQIRIRQVVTNLISNAIKFTPENGTINIVTKLLTPYPPFPSDQSSGSSNIPSLPSHIGVRIEVHDTGPGIKAEEMKANRLFSPYVQTHQGLEQGGKGTGLGLALIRSIVQHSRGRLGVQSKYGVGSCFWVEFGLGIADCSSAPPPTPGLDYRSHYDFKPVSELLSEISAATEPVDRPKRPPLRPSLTPVGSLSKIGSSISTPSSYNTEYGYLPILLDKGSKAQPHEREITSDSEVSVKRRSMDSAAFLDLKRPSTSRTDSSVGELDPRSSTRLRCLIVEDDPVTRMLMGRMLKRLGLEVEQAENGQIALDLCLGTNGREPRHYDVIFMDNQMPVLNGTVVSTKIKEAGRKDWIVGVTGNALKEDQEEYLRKGADEVLTNLWADARKQACDGGTAHYQYREGEAKNCRIPDTVAFCRLELQASSPSDVFLRPDSHISPQF
ncbi:hypothetical protein BT69DRAFT_1323821 [Atractiella rhizophila]|nr:hypothetical protein BT69DRAFT_1323821 [Atractiella rhizophila]